MKKYFVFVREVWVQKCEVKAKSPEEALQKALAGEDVVLLDNELEYSHTPDEMTTIEHVEED